MDFQADYLYNTVDYDLNFRNIFVRDFQPDRLTSGLDSITLYMAGSIRSPGPGLAFIDDNTKSSLLESAGDLSPMAWGDSRNVLALADLSFMVPPQDSLTDNDRLVSNIADYLTESERTYGLAEFPHFYETGPHNEVDILLGQSSLLSSGLQVKSGAGGLWSVIGNQFGGRFGPGHRIPRPVRRLVPSGPLPADCGSAD